MKLITIKLSHQQFEALRNLEKSTGKNKSELIRYALGVVSELEGKDFPQNVTKRGKYERNKN
jgi:predicted DNA-binding protein